MQSQREEEGRDLSVCMCLSWEGCVCRGWREQKGDRLFSGVPSDNNGHKLKYWKLNRRCFFFFFYSDDAHTGHPERLHSYRHSKPN